MDPAIHTFQLNREHLRKCGEISALLSEDKEEFYLTCGFCDVTYLQLDSFIQHIYEDHLSELPTIKHGLTNTRLGLENMEVNLKVNVEDANIFEELLITEDELDDIEEELSKDLCSENLLGSEDENTVVSNGFEKVLLKTNEVNIKDKFFEGVRSEKYLESGDTQHVLMGIENINDKEKLSKGSESEKHLAKSKPIPKKAAIVPRSFINDAELIALAKIYKRYSCLWDEKNIEFRFKNRREEALQSVYNDFTNESGLKLKLDDFKSEVTRLRKICSSEKKEKLSCTQKKTIYQSTCPYYKEIEFLEVDVPPFECSICGKLLSALAKLKKHIASHDGSLPFKCHVCGHGFQLGSNLTVHLRRHVQDYTFRCKVCNKPCATTPEIKVHMRTHTGEKPFICSICGFKAVTSSNLFSHTQRHSKRPRHKCIHCPRMFYETGALKEHMSVHSSKRDEVCDICNKGFADKKRLRQHKLIHNTEKKYLCKICGKRFAQSGGLRAHMKSHGTML